MIIHIIGTVNGQINEGMRNVATHLAKEFEKSNTVLYSNLKQLPNIIINSKKADVTLIFARANKLVYELTNIVEKLCKNTWLVLVQRPDAYFLEKNKKHILRCNYLSLTKADVTDIKIASGKKKSFFTVGIDVNKFVPISKEKQSVLKKKYGFDPEQPLITHVGHCSKGRGLEDFIKITKSQHLIVASGMFEDKGVIARLNEAKVKIYRGYLQNIEEIYQMSDAYLFPTKSPEFVISIPLSVTEALSCGVPVIGYSSFDNLREIDSIQGSISLIENADEIDQILPGVIKKRSNYSLLKNPDSWNTVASKVQKMLQEDIR